jgi:hypothetical protein
MPFRWDAQSGGFGAVFQAREKFGRPWKAGEHDVLNVFAEPVQLMWSSRLRV